MKLHVLCIAYQRPVQLRMLIDSFVLQTDHRWDLHVIHDGPPSENILKVMDLHGDPRIRLEYDNVQVGNIGHSLRRSKLQALRGEIDDYVLITNDDNVYVPRFVEFMLQYANMDTGIIYCNTVHSNLVYRGQISELRVNHIDMGAFIVQLPLAQEVGFNSTLPHADGIFARQCKQACIKKGLIYLHVNKFLFIHN
jgi:GT2 family glycosyltransferase